MAREQRRGEQRGGEGIGDYGSLTAWILSDNSFRDCPQKCRSIPWELRFITWGIWGGEKKSQDAGLIRCFQGKHRYKERLNTICSSVLLPYISIRFFLKSCPVIPVAAVGALKCRKRRTFFFFHAVWIRIHKGTEPAPSSKSVNCTIWKLTDIIAPEHPSGTLCGGETIRFLVRARVLRPTEKANPCMWYPSSHIPRACFSMNEGRREAVQGEERESEGIGREAVERWMGKGSKEC